MCYNERIDLTLAAVLAPRDGGQASHSVCSCKSS